jgi:hypothetical protein
LLACPCAVVWASLSQAAVERHTALQGLLLLLLLQLTAISTTKLHIVANFSNNLF